MGRMHNLARSLSKKANLPKATKATKHEWSLFILGNRYYGKSTTIKEQDSPLPYKNFYIARDPTTIINDVQASSKETQLF